MNEERKENLMSEECMSEIVNSTHTLYFKEFHNLDHRHQFSGNEREQ